MALGTGAMRVPRPAAGMMTRTFIAGCQYTSAQAASSNAICTLPAMRLDIQCQNLCHRENLFHAIRQTSRSLAGLQCPNHLLPDGDCRGIRGRADLLQKFND